MIVYVVDRYPSVSQTFVHNEVQELRRQGVDVRVIALDRAGEPDNGVARLLRPSSWAVAIASGLTLLFVSPLGACRLLVAAVVLRGEHGRLLLGAIPALTLALRRQGVTHVHSHFAWGASAVGLALAGGLRCPFSLTVHARDLYVDGKNLAAKLRMAKTIVTVCEFNRPLLVEAGADRSKIVLVRCGVRTDVESQDSGATYDVLAVGRLVPKKGYPTLLSALALLKDRGLTVRCGIVGDGLERGTIEALIATLDLSGSVSLLGARPHADTLGLMLKSRMLCMPAVPAADGDSDALPVVVFEAMARGVPVVASALAGIPEMIDEETGWLVTPSSPEELADAIQCVIDRPDLADSRRRAATTRVRREASLDREVARLRRQVLTGVSVGE